MCIALGKTPDELGEYSRRDPVGFAFLERAIAERATRRAQAVSQGRA